MPYISLYQNRQELLEPRIIYFRSEKKTWQEFITNKFISARRQASSQVSSIGSRSKPRKTIWIATTTPLKGVAAVDIKPAAVLHHQHNNFSALCDLCEPLNVIVIGPHDSGTTVINSLLMSVRGKWTDRSVPTLIMYCLTKLNRAKYGHGSAHQLSPVLVYENPNHHHQNCPEHKYVLDLTHFLH